MPASPTHIPPVRVLEVAHQGLCLYLPPHGQPRAWHPSKQTSCIPLAGLQSMQKALGAKKEESLPEEKAAQSQKKTAQLSKEKNEHLSKQGADSLRHPFSSYFWGRTLVMCTGFGQPSYGCLTLRGTPSS